LEFFKYSVNKDTRKARSVPGELSLLQHTIFVLI
jgi:hypothetical protein